MEVSVRSLTFQRVLARWARGRFVLRTYRRKRAEGVLRRKFHTLGLSCVVTGTNGETLIRTIVINGGGENASMDLLYIIERHHINLNARFWSL